jgi:peptidoglycan/xylan/chitin deacetylase (PgdA/CDA1 family)
MRQVLLTFDLEEFDIPLEYGLHIEWQEQLEVGRQGMKNVINLLNFHKVPTTIFTTASYALENKEQVRYLAKDHEIASHSYHHSSYKEEDLLASRIALEAITGKIVTGLRMPRMKQVSMDAVYTAGYIYDSSVNPTYVPGKYNNLHLPVMPYKENGILRLPCSVGSGLRFPLFWLTFKNVPYFLYKKMAIQSLRKTGFLNLYFHPWEFVDISRYKLPFHIKRHSGETLLDKLDKLITDLKREGNFTTISNFLQDSGNTEEEKIDTRLYER